jgi:hypothetical protein
VELASLPHPAAASTGVFLRESAAAAAAAEALRERRMKRKVGDVHRVMNRVPRACVDEVDTIGGTAKRSGVRASQDRAILIGIRAGTNPKENDRDRGA